MSLLLFTQLLALAGLIFAVTAFARRWQAVQRRPVVADHAPAKGSPQRGVRYAFTLGMAPWAKESTRRHMLAYLRGIGFHVGIFAGLGALLVGPLQPFLPAPLIGWLALITGLGAAFGFMGEIMRWLDHNLRVLSTPDDHASVLLVSVWLTATTVALLYPAWQWAMYALAALMLVYAPLGKIRHCIYFYFSRLFFGLFVGRRAVLHPETPTEVTR